jgi:DNA-directed RNA polymerase
VSFSDTVKGALLGRRYTRRNRLKIPGKRRSGRHLSETPVGKQVIAQFMKPMVDRLKKGIDPPGNLANAVKTIPPEDLAQAVLVPLLHGIFIVWRDERKGKKSSTARQNLSVAVGQYLHALLVRHKLLTDGEVPDRQKLLASLSRKPRRHRRKKGEPPRKRGRKLNKDARNLTFNAWDRRDLAQVGDWLIEQAMALPCFTYDRSRRPYLPAIAPQWMKPEWINRILAIKRYFIGLDDQQLPDFKPIPPWTAPVRGNLRFVNNYRRDTQEAIAEAFAPAPFCLVAGCQEQPPYPADFEHARGVSALERVRHKLDRFMVDLVERVRPALLEREMERKEARDRDRRNRRNMLSEDISFARVTGARPFYMQHRCDFRGRVYQVPYLNMQREDHVRSLFKFANGRKLGSRNVGGKLDDCDAGVPCGFTDHEMLEIYCANCAGQDKLLWDGRLQWVKDNRSLIEAIGNDPIAMQSEWQDFDDPFCFVAACRELVAAWNDPHFVSCLPVFFDGTANGFQHLSALVRDRETAEKVNLIGNKKSDVYGLVSNALELILQDANGEHADRWRERYAALKPKQRRALVKQPVMTYPYGVERGMNLQVWKEYNDLFPDEEAPPGYFGFISAKIEDAIKKELPGAHECREYLRNLTAQTLDKGRFVQTIGPTGFPLISSYLERKTIPVYAHDGGCMRIKTGETDKVLRDEAIRSTAPNFTHSLDAAHLIPHCASGRRGRYCSDNKSRLLWLPGRRCGRLEPNNTSRVFSTSPFFMAGSSPCAKCPGQPSPTAGQLES